MSSYRSVLRTLLLICCIAVVGCDRLPKGEPVAEINEPDYVEGKRLSRQGNEQGALAAFTRVINSRPEDAAESHLEVGLLYSEHVNDPVAAIYHFRRYLELKPNSQQRELVEQRIAVAFRDFARTLPAQPLENQAMRSDLLDVVERLKVENTRLKDEVALLRAATSADGPAALRQTANLSAQPLTTRPAQTTSRFSAAPIEPEPQPRTVAPPTRPEAAPAASARRVHTVVKGDTLYSLARRYYNNSTRSRDIYEANRNQMRSQNDLQIGMQLVIPE
ncbi:Cell division protein CpoB [Actomonas aquatica]|uniref:LysM peptidoglycan-binding domain-containing protein n=1 Tax=Actomonas aquatica TaxID=2866162 RepID=A0ABZ1C5L6_9BACT|nr:LysM peptidoglycan-binding domain-containing protein [Opitutus sp. WL0086]WRQ86811.1 LysM peptidoglycan-binding domain-containing protein [Opitutus sp. WL0086]